MKNIAVLTSGGDAPGMNAAIRAVVRSAFHYGITPYGVRDGFKGLCEDNLFRMTRKDVTRIINRGGTILGSARYPQFKEADTQKKAVQNLKSRSIDGLIVLGGDGSFRGAKVLADAGIKTIGLPATIDNDIAATDYTIGFFTALDTAVESIDKLRDTSFSHQRCSVVEVMGRHCGDLALYAGIACGSEFIITPETGFDKDKTIKAVKQSFDRNKRHAIVVVTERMTDVFELAKQIEKATTHETRATVLGHVQRGGNPQAFDRVIAIEMAEKAVYLLSESTGNKIIALHRKDVVAVSFDEALTAKKELPSKRYGLFGKLSTEEGKDDTV